MALIKCVDLFKIYNPIMSQGIPIIRGLSIDLFAHEMIALQGVSGSGKTTLMNLIVGKIFPDAGEIFLNNRNLLKLNRYQRYHFIQKNIAFVHQNIEENLFLDKTVRQNIELPLKFSNNNPVYIQQKVTELLHLVNLEHKRNSMIKHLSGGERQKVAICCAIVNEQPILFLDEPTGDLDTPQSIEIITYLRDFLLQNVVSLIFIATHDPSIAKLCDKIYVIQDGRISGYYDQKKGFIYDPSQETSSSENLVKENETEIQIVQIPTRKVDYKIIINKDGTLTIPNAYLKTINLPAKYLIREITSKRIVLESEEGNEKEPDT